MPSAAAWAVLSAPLWLTAVLVPIIRWRRRPRPDGEVKVKDKGRSSSDPDAPKGRGGRKRRHTLQSAPREAPIEIGQLTPAQELLLTRSGGRPSLYDCFLGIGPDLEALRGFRKVLAEACDSHSWAAMVQEKKLDRIEALSTQWAREAAVRRLAGWLSANPAVKGGGLLVQVPASLEGQEVENLTLTHADGLRADLSDEQKNLLFQARRTLSRVLQVSDRPFPLLVAAGATGMRSILPSFLTGEGDRTHAPYALSLVLGGLSALDGVAGAGLNPPEISAEFRDALREHAKLVGTALPAEGCAVHAIELIGGGKLDGIGMLLASVAGAAFSTSSVVLRISTRAAEKGAKDTFGVLPRLGALIAAVLDDQNAPDRGAVMANLAWILGEDLLHEEQSRAGALAREFERQTAKDPLWKTSPGSPELPDLALINLHLRRVHEGLLQGGPARDRLLQIFQKLAKPGDRPEERQLGFRRLGYAAAGLGMPLVRSTSTELLSAAREAVSSAESL